MHTMTDEKTLTENVFPQFQDVNRYLTGSAFCKAYSVRKELFLIDKAYIKNDLEALSVLQTMHSWLVIHIARRFQNSGIPLNTLISVGKEALRKAIASYIPNDSTRLSTHCSEIIRKDILVYALNNWRSTDQVEPNKTGINIGWLSQNEIVAIAKKLGINAETINQMKTKIE